MGGSPWTTTSGWVTSGGAARAGTKGRDRSNPSGWVTSGGAAEAGTKSALVWPHVEIQGTFVTLMRGFGPLKHASKASSL